MYTYPIQRAVSLTLILLVLLASPALHAQDQIPLTDLLRNDGTLDLTQGLEGSVDVSGFRMTTGPDGTPQFLPEGDEPEGSWDEGFAMPGLNGRVRALVVIGTDLYIGGDFTQIGDQSANNIARWDETTSTWHPLGTGMNNGVNNIVHALAVLDADLYVGGEFTQAGDQPANFIARWDGTSWHTLGTGMNASVVALTVMDGDLYVGGDFTQAGGQNGINRVARWDGATWHALGTGMNNGVNNWVIALTVLDGDLYVGGDFTQAGGQNGINRIARWDGATWHALGTGMNGIVVELAVLNDDLYVGGEFTSAGGQTGISRIARWDGTTWHPLGGGTSGTIVRALAVLGGDLYVGGDFTQAGGQGGFNRIARWDGAAWHPLGVGMNGTVWSLAVLDGDLYVGGDFTEAGDHEANRIARWTPADGIAYQHTVGSENEGPGWRMLTSPLDGATVQNLANANLVRGLDDEYPGGDLNLYLGYTGDNDNEDPHRGFVPATERANPLVPGKGFIWYLFDANYNPPEENGSSQSHALPFDLTFIGSPVVENHSVEFTDDDRSSLTDDGFYLIGNPYVESYNVRGIAPSSGGYSMTYQHWDAETGAYVQLDGLEDHEAAVAAGFFMQFGNLPTLPVTITFGPPGSGPPVPPPGDPVQHFTARFELSGELVAVYEGDEYPMDISDRNARVIFADDATDGFDIYDAGKLTPISYYWANVALMGMQGDEMVRRSVESRPLPLEPVTIPMAFSTYANGLEAGGTFTIIMKENGLGDGWQAHLIDLETGDIVNILTDSYTFTIEAQPAIDADERFEIVFTPPTVSGDDSGETYVFGMQPIWPNPTIANAQVAFTLETAGEITIDVFDVLGRRVLQMANGEYSAGRHVLPLSTSTMASGVYVVRLTAGSQVAVQRITVAR